MWVRFSESGFTVNLNPVSLIEYLLKQRLVCLSVCLFVAILSFTRNHTHFSAPTCPAYISTLLFKLSLCLKHISEIHLFAYRWDSIQETVHCRWCCCRHHCCCCCCCCCWWWSVYRTVITQSRHSERGTVHSAAGPVSRWLHRRDTYQTTQDICLWRLRAESRRTRHTTAAGEQHWQINKFWRPSLFAPGLCNMAAWLCRD